MPSSPLSRRRPVSAAEAARAAALGRILAAPATHGRTHGRSAATAQPGGHAPRADAHAPPARPSTMAAAAAGWSDMHTRPSPDSPA
ncbi:hypothetical protein [Streptomyces sp. NPDC059708]|uniref:hypothetical protein n=1 Tax=Streptomyces sp. NPDC059708 TaxID=3346916 RepID=UPI0036C87E46